MCLFSFQGTVIVGEELLTYYNADFSKTIQVPLSVPTTYAKIDDDGKRWLISDSTGSLYILGLDFETTAASAASSAAVNATGKGVNGLTLERLGEATLASTLSYLDKGYVFVGSSFGDSQLVRLLHEADPATNEFLELVESYTSLAPIIDFTVMDLERQGEGQVVTCSGFAKEGSLRVIRNGIGIEEQAVVDLPGVKGVWNLREKFTSRFDKYLVHSFSSETRIFSIEDENMDETEIPGFDANTATLHASNVVNDHMIQVTRAKVKLVNCATLKCVDTWEVPDADVRITMASSSAEQVLVALAGGKLCYLEIHPTSEATFIRECKQVTMPHEISSVSINPLISDEVRSNANLISISQDGDDVEMVETDSNNGKRACRATMAAVSLWDDITLRMLSLPSLTELECLYLGGDIQARSVMLVTIEDINYLVAGMADGHVITYQLGLSVKSNSKEGDVVDAVSAGKRKKVSLGTQPVQLSLFSTMGLGDEHVNIFAACDRPSVMYSSGKKLLYTNMNVNDVSFMCQFDSASFPDCLVLVTTTNLLIGTVDDIQKLHIRTLWLKEQPRKISYSKQLRVLAVATLCNEETDQKPTVAYLRIFDDTSFQPVDSFELRPLEQVQSIACGSLTESSSDSRSDSSTPEYIFVGTAFVIEGEEEPSSGRILVFSVTGSDENRRLNLIWEQVENGGVMALLPFNGKLVAGINHAVTMYKWEDASVPQTGGNESAAASSAVAEATADSEALERSLTREATFAGNTFVLYLASTGDYIAVGDIMTSVTVLQYREDLGVLSQVSKDPASVWTTSVDMLDAETVVLAEVGMHLFTMKRNTWSISTEKRQYLNVIGQFHVGDIINRLARGSLAMIPQPETSADVVEPGGEGNDHGDAQVIDKFAKGPIPHHIYGTISGAIGVMIRLPKPLYEYLLGAQAAMRQVISGVGALRHEEWRAYYSNETYVEGIFEAETRGYIDGDLLELFLDLDVATQNEILEIINKSPPAPGVSAEGDSRKHPDGKDNGPATLEELQSTIEELNRLH